MKINKESNIYTIIYIVVLVVLVGSALKLAGLLHGAGTGGHEAQTVGKTEGAGSNEGRKLAERVAGCHVRSEVGLRLGNDYRVEEYGRLSDVGAAEVLVGAVEHEVGDAET